MTPQRTTEVWVALGDSEMAGREDPAAAPVGYPPLSGLKMFRTGGPYATLAEPCADGVYPPVGVGPGGMFAWQRSQYLGAEVCLVNCAVGGVKSSQWMPSESPSSLYRMALARAHAAITQPGCYLAGYLLYDGANDATEAVCTWSANWTTTLAALQAELGAARVVYTQLPPTEPTDMSYPTWDDVRAQQAAWASAQRAMVAAPDGPWREAYKLHLNMAGNVDLAGRYAALVNA